MDSRFFACKINPDGTRGECITYKDLSYLIMSNLVPITITIAFAATICCLINSYFEDKRRHRIEDEYYREVGYPDHWNRPD